MAQAVIQLCFFFMLLFSVPFCARSEAQPKPAAPHSTSKWGEGGGGGAALQAPGRSELCACKPWIA